MKVKYNVKNALISNLGTLQPVAYKQEYVNLHKEEEVVKSKPVVAARSENGKIFNENFSHSHSGYYSNKNYQ